MRKLPEIISVLYIAQVHSKEKRFFIPKEVLQILNHSEEDPIGLTVRKASGKTIFCGEHKIVSGELYGPEFSSLVCSEIIWIEATKPKPQQ